VTRLGVLHAEWTKLRSVRSTVWTLLVALGLMVGIGAALAQVSAGQYASPAAARADGFAPVPASLNGVASAQLAIGVLGALVVTAEYGTGMIRATLAAVPRRLPVLWAKLAVFAAVVLPLALAGSLAAFLVGQALLRGPGLSVGLGSPGAARSVVGAGLYLTVGGLIGVAIGAVLRNTAAAISTYVGVFFVLPPLVAALPAAVDRHVLPYLPSYAGEAVYRDFSGLDWLSPWAGFSLFCAYAVVLIGVAAWRLLRFDA
jgi:ABC-2 type transport system permease protein